MASILAVYFLSLLYIIFLHCKIVTHEKHFNSQRETRIVENGKQNNISLTIRNDSNTMNAYSHNQSTNMNNPKQMTKVDETDAEMYFIYSGKTYFINKIILVHNFT